MSVTDVLLQNNARHAETFAARLKGAGPQLAILACMDARIDVYRVLGLADGQAHVIRNAGGVVTDDEIRSLAISQRLLGSREIVLIHHTGCGMLTFDDAEFRDGIEAEVGIRPPWHSEAFPDLEDDVRASIQKILDSPFVPVKDSVRGFVLDLDTAKLHEVS